MRHLRRAAAFFFAVFLASALAGCGTPFFISQQNLADVLGKEYLYAGVGTGVDAYDIDWATGRITKLAGSPFGGGSLSPSGPMAPTS